MQNQSMRNNDIIVGPLSPPPRIQGIQGPVGPKGDMGRPGSRGIPGKEVRNS